jgi:hypothetical protein
MRGIEDSWEATLFLVLIYGIYKTIKKIKNWKTSLIITIIPMLFFTFTAFNIKNNIIVTLLITFLIATILNLYLTFSIYKSWKEYNNSLHVQCEYDPELTFRQYYSENI